MKHVIEQLKFVRQTGKWLLLTQRLMQWSMWFMLLGLILCVLDYTLNLPGGVRLFLGLIVLSLLGLWGYASIWPAICFRPSLEEIALRVERKYPEIQGKLGSAVAFWLEENKQAKRTDDGHRMGIVFRNALMHEVDHDMRNVKIGNLIQMRNTTNALSGMMVLLMVVSGIGLFAGDTLVTGAGRWLLPLSDVRWPQRVYVQDLMNEDQFLPIDRPVKFSAAIEKGHQDGMRVFAHYRIRRDGKLGRWQSVLMNRQGLISANMTRSDQADKRGLLPRYEQLVELNHELDHMMIQQAANDHSVSQNNQDPIEMLYYLEAGDDITDQRVVRLIDRPKILQLSAKIIPPLYAKDFVQQKTEVLYEVGSKHVKPVRGLIGSQVTLVLRTNKSVEPNGVDTIFPEFYRMSQNNRSDLTSIHRLEEKFGLSITFDLEQHEASIICLHDEYNLSRETDWQLKLIAVTDENPSVSMRQPGGDLGVLASAQVPLLATAQDDLGLSSMRMLLHENKSKTDKNVSLQDIIIGSSTLRQAEDQIELIYDLTPLKLESGESVQIYAEAEDVYELNGNRHNSVRSNMRTVRIIEERELISQIRGELGALREHAIRVGRMQNEVMDKNNTNFEAQARVGERLGGMQRMTQRIDNRMSMNRMNDAQLAEMTSRADELISMAERASREAEKQLKIGDFRAKQQEQSQVSELMNELVSALDQGRDAMGLQLQLRQLEALQSAIMTDTREMLPRTVGLDHDQLDDQMKAGLETIRKQQEDLAAQAEAMIKQMQQSAEQLARTDDDKAAAAAESLKDAAKIGQRSGLSGKMSQAAKQASKNQLSQAAQTQAELMQVMRDMLQQMQDQETRRTAALERRLAKLVMQLKKLVVDQNHERTKIKDTTLLLKALEKSQLQIRRRTQAAVQVALGSDQTKDVAGVIKEAATKQGDAILAMRSGQRAQIIAEQGRAVELLEEALRQVQQIKRNKDAAKSLKQRQELRDAYLKLAEQQEALRQKVSQWEGKEKTSRRERAQMIKQAAIQMEIGKGVSVLGEKVKEANVFRHEHDRIIVLSDYVTRTLRRGVMEELVLRSQDQISRSLRMMAAVLDEQMKDSAFNEGQSGGSGGGQGGDKAKMIPPLAELKLLRGMQAALIEETVAYNKVIEERNIDSGKLQDDQVLQAISTRQRDLAVLAEKMIEQMKKASSKNEQPEERTNGGQTDG
ncbi:hypothetical protein [Poriferisphaera sp. WC338]|uniref:hypothetical protein n=1 Tax=Poriferisphaera sp. WC338 TaxID=3425129 RepID=UPI003D816875